MRCVISDNHTPDEALSNAAHFSGIHVGEALLKHNALLIPDVYNIFLDKLTEITRVCSIVLEDVKSTASPSWLRNQLSTLLEHHMAYIIIDALLKSTVQSCTSMVVTLCMPSTYHLVKLEAKHKKSLRWEKVTAVQRQPMQHQIHQWIQYAIQIVLPLEHWKLDIKPISQ